MRLPLVPGPCKYSCLYHYAGILLTYRCSEDIYARNQANPPVAPHDWRIDTLDDDSFVYQRVIDDGNGRPLRTVVSVTEWDRAKEGVES